MTKGHSDRVELNIPMSHVRQQLTLFDSICLIAGVIIGVGIYQMMPQMAAGAGSGGGLLLLVFLGGMISLCGALAYAELASAIPEEGGDYVYLTRAYGRWAGFLFGWVQTTIVRPGDIAVMAFAFATYALSATGSPAGRWGESLLAAASVAVLTAINVAGVTAGKRTQNLLTVAKALGLLSIVGIAFLVPRPEIVETEVPGFPPALAFIFVLFAYGGWNEMAYVAAEIKNPRKNIARALTLGTLCVTGLYLLLALAFLWTLGYAGTATSKAVAVDAVDAAFPRWGGTMVGLLICISALGAVNGLIFTGARISYAVGKDHPLFRPLGRWNETTQTPARALLLQGLLTIVLILALGDFITTIIYTSSVVYSFYFATSLAVIVLRFRAPSLPRPYRTFGYPVTILVFAAVCLYMLYSAVTYKPDIALAALGIALAGLAIYWIGLLAFPRPPAEPDGGPEGSDTEATDRAG